jgi:hypothetical protein
MQDAVLNLDTLFDYTAYNFIYSDYHLRNEKSTSRKL